MTVGEAAQETPDIHDSTDRMPPPTYAFSGRVRAAAVLSAFAAFTLPLMPLQALFKRIWSDGARRLPHWYHARVCRLLGIRIDRRGEVLADRSVLLVSNHTSWLDIPVLSAVAPVSFVAKREVGTWPGIGTLARLQRTVFVDRERRTEVGRTAGAIAERLGRGDTVVLFAEGTSSDGNRVLPFRSSLFAAALPKPRVAEAAPKTNPSTGSPSSASAAPAIVVQTVSIVYAKIHGVPLGRADRPLIGWYGDMEMVDHGWGVLSAGPIDVIVEISEAIPLDTFADRKAVARATEADVRARVLANLRDARAGGDG